jgi:hypothetical protein
MVKVPANVFSGTLPQVFVFWKKPEGWLLVVTHRITWRRLPSRTSSLVGDYTWASGRLVHPRMRQRNKAKKEWCVRYGNESADWITLGLVYSIAKGFKQVVSPRSCSVLNAAPRDYNIAFSTNHICVWPSFAAMTVLTSSTGNSSRLLPVHSLSCSNP